MFTTLSTFFGPMVAIETDIRIGYEIRYRGHWEFRDTLEIIECFQQHYADQSGIMLDLGCNIGSWTLPLAQRYPKNTVMSFDCQSAMIECLNQTIQLNNLTNVQTRHCAISDSCKTEIKPDIDYTWGVNFGAYEYEPPWHNSDFNCKTTDSRHKVTVVTIDSLEMDRVVFIKLDIEGMEYQALQGGIKTIQRDHPFIAFENHKTNRAAAEGLCRDLGYKIAKTVGQMTLAIPT